MVRQGQVRACKQRKTTTAKRESEETFGQHVTEGRQESAEAAAHRVGDLSVGGNCQSDSWYGSNLTSLRLAGLVIVHIQLALLN